MAGRGWWRPAAPHRAGHSRPRGAIAPPHRAGHSRPQKFERKDAKDAKDLLWELESVTGRPLIRTVVPDSVNVVSNRLIGAAIEVHRHLGPGFVERAYEEALAIELQHRGVAFERQRAMPIHCKGHVVWSGQVDLVIENLLVVELRPSSQSSRFTAHSCTRI